MDDDTVSQFKNLMINADNYHKEAKWQEKLRTLQDALKHCNDSGFPEAERRKQQVLYQIGGIRRRFGQYSTAVTTLQEALEAFEHASPIVRANILGELGVVFRHSNDFSKARKVFIDQYGLARNTALESEVELCRAIGNAGMAAYNLSQQQQPQDDSLLQIAFAQLRERIDRARALRARLVQEDSQSRYIALSKSWETIGMDRLTLCYVAAGDTAEAVSLAEESQRTQSTDDPTIKAFSRFFYGHALWHNGQTAEALHQWSAPLGVCASAMALCKEPSLEHADYLKLLSQAGVDFDSYDEQGFSPLDYAVLSDTVDAKQMVAVILDAYRNTLREQFGRYYPPLDESQKEQKIREEISVRMRQSELRKHYRAILQERMRPELRSENADSIHELRKIYRQVLAENPILREVFDPFDYVKYSVFRDHRRLPLSLERLSKRFERQVEESADDDEDDFIIFFSYRWIGRISDPPLEGPDDINDTQWHRMMIAINDFLAKKGKRINPDRLSLWLDCACIDQREPDRRSRGIDALPLAVTQCDAMISLVDEEYYERAWCAVEVMLMRELVKSYGLHEWWEHVLHAPHTNRVEGSLRKGRINRDIDTRRLKLTKENEDRPKIDFLVRQSKLLGKDDA
ncbi:hypothetical protein LTR70_008269 [Exophiala xenobiotica]|uniref:Uncharacterized protein n=1 Tax=Lithohypha guttulata TaxID=1690604 RepID=A0ABR0K2Q9_9EURO|nr:hypothetical protein LTR24_007665 [Lithohypha guttulata]KAK5312345.1 hypothetical protein LTR70_008269 [Exophiala xenobiotica]